MLVMMKRLYLLLCSLFVAFLAHSQAPQLVNYQAVVRNAAGDPLPNGRLVSVRFTIHDQTATGTIVFSENDTARTNEFGLITLRIGTLGNLATVNWGNGPKYLEVDLDPNGGNNFTEMGTSQLISVPYALYAANSQAGLPAQQAWQVSVALPGLPEQRVHPV